VVGWHHGCDLGRFGGDDVGKPWIGVPRRLACLMTNMTPAKNSQRRYWSPCLDISPKRCLPPVEFCFVTIPIHADIM